MLREIPKNSVSATFRTPSFDQLPAKRRCKFASAISGRKFIYCKTAQNLQPRGKSIIYKFGKRSATAEAWFSLVSRRTSVRKRLKYVRRSNLTNSIDLYQI